MAEKTKNRTAMVTGAGSGIGRATANELAARGWAVAVVDLRSDSAQAVADEIIARGGEAIGLEADVRSRAALNAAVVATELRFGPIGTVVANAGMAPYPTPIDEYDDEQFDTIFDVNVKGTWNTVRATVDSLRKAGGGSIVITGSIMGVRPRPGQAAYAASKAAANHLARSFALDLAGDSIRVNAVAPVATDTAMLPMFLGKDHPEEARAAFIQGIPLRRLASPEDVARAITFLASEDAAFITGAVLPLDGGRSI
ncbi:SDR family oxidoreductase [Aminobacter sp. MSH1]|uniref:SDR family NAD(P)-dependent oxidoreductase n=1 Tax=Aminobacter sp. MSH1 TaxID=374606 RepID=UPI00131EF027|nr:SDR family oxidoreductase [Aminobacter sp. MSH1]